MIRKHAYLMMPPRGEFRAPDGALTSAQQHVLGFKLPTLTCVYLGAHAERSGVKSASKDTDCAAWLLRSHAQDPRHDFSTMLQCPRRIKHAAFQSQVKSAAFGRQTHAGACLPLSRSSECAVVNVRSRNIEVVQLGYLSHSHFGLTLTGVSLTGSQFVRSVSRDATVPTLMSAHFR